MSNLQPTESTEVKLKIGLVGESGVGKSCILVRWVDNDFFDQDDKYTIGVDFKFKVVNIKGKQVKLQIYDTAGQERFRTVTASFYRGAHGILLVYDITDADSFHGKVEEWLREIRNYTPENTPIVFIGNKTDLSNKRAIDTQTAKSWAENEGLTYIETSAKDGTNINEAFMLLAEKIVDNKFAQRKETKSVVQVANSTEKKKGPKFC